MKNKRIFLEIGSGAVLIIAAFFFLNRENTNQSKIFTNEFAVYSNPDFKISLAYPFTWQINVIGKAFNKMALSYGGDDGFFGVDALVGSPKDEPIRDVKIGEVADRLIKDGGGQYGSSPSITTSTIAAAEAVFIFPSQDQPKIKNSEAALVIRYPKPIEIGKGVYLYFMLYADKFHLREIANTLKFQGF